MNHPPCRPAVPAPFRLAVPARGALVLAGGLLLAGTVLAGCAAGKPAAGQAAAQRPPSGSRQPGRAGFGGAGGPAAFGLLAEIDAHVLQVQNQSTGQVSVSYSATTEFSQTKQVTRTALQVGACVTAIGQRSPSSGSPSASPSGGSSGQPSPPTTFAAASVQIASAVNGSCVTAGLAGGRGGTRPSGFPSGRPNGFPSGRPSGFPSGRPSNLPSGQRGGFGFGNFATGKVTSLSSAGMTVQTPARGQQPASMVTVTLSATTSYTETLPATASALRVGECVSASGKADSTGAVAANRIELSAPTNGSCTTGGFGRWPGASASPSGS